MDGHLQSLPSEQETSPVAPAKRREDPILVQEPLNVYNPEELLYVIGNQIFLPHSCIASSRDRNTILEEVVALSL